MSNGYKVKQPVTVTREELYEQVWQTPMVRLAEQYGLSGNGLAKICDRLEVPYPPRGSWNKRAAGKNVVRYRLQNAGPGVPAQVRITPTPAKLPAPKLSPQIESELEVAKAKVAEIKVPARLTRPHPIVAKWLADHQRRKEEARRHPSVWGHALAPAAFTPLERRKHLIFHALFTQLERHGGIIKQDRGMELNAVFQGLSIEFQIREKQKQIRRPVRDDEKQYYIGKSGIRTELVNTGKLVFAIKTHIESGYKTEWLETEETSLESMLPEIIAAFVTAVPILVQRQKERDEAARQHAIAERIRYEKERREKIDQNQWSRLVDIADIWRDVENARAFIAKLKATPFDPAHSVGDRTLAEWIDWADQKVSWADPLRHRADGIFADVARINEWNYRKSNN